MDSAQWTQDFGAAKSMAELGACTRPTMEKKIRPQKDLALNCPRCHSTNTKFCYYNNYSLTQPRYFCKTCRRYWTEGGTLRNVPVGGGSRKNMKKSSSTPHPTTPSHKLPDLNPPSISQFSDQQNPNKFHDLNLGFSQDYHIPQFIELPKTEGTNVINTCSSSTNSSSTPISALNFLRHGGLMINTFNPMAAPTEANAMFAPSFPFQECKASLSFPVDGININGDRYTNPNLHQESNGSLMFTLGGAITKQSSGTGEGDHGDKGRDNSNGFWSGMLGGGSW